MAETAWEHPKGVPGAQADLQLRLQKMAIAILQPPLVAPAAMAEMAWGRPKAARAATVEQHLPEVIQGSLIRVESLRLGPQPVGWEVQRARLLQATVQMSPPVAVEMQRIM
jgi:hypothetical protein